MAIAVPPPVPAQADDPPVAAVDDGGPCIDPGVLCPPVKFKYEVVRGFFVQNDPSIARRPFEPVLLDHSFGMIDTSPERWANLDAVVKWLQEDAEEGVQYKVFFLARHGQGWHNVGALKYGVDPWESHWTFVNGDGELVWGPDPELSPKGVEQAPAVNRAWKREKEAGAPLEAGRMKWYCSPLTRTGQTLQESFKDVLAGTPEVWEDWREIIGSHTCDKRSSRSHFASRFPTFKIEKGFSEEDVLWTAEKRETDQEMQVRARRAFDRVFSVGGAEERSIVRNMLAILGHGPYPLTTGEMIPVVVKATPVEQADHGVNGDGANGH